MARESKTNEKPATPETPQALPDPVALMNELLDMCEELEPEQQARALYEASQVLQRSGSSHYHTVLDAYRKAATARPTQQGVIQHAQALATLEAEHERRAAEQG